MTKAETINLVNLLTIALGKMSDDEKQSANDLNKLFKRSGIFDIEKSSIPFNAGGYVQQVINILNTDLIAEENKAQAKANGDTKRLKAALDWQKRNKKMNTIREMLAYPDYQDDMQVYTDGHMVVVLKNYLGFEEKPESLCGEYGLSYKKAIPNTHDEEIAMPDIAKLKVWYKNEKNYIVTFNTPTKKNQWKVFSVYKVPKTTDYLLTNFATKKDKLAFIEMITKRSLYDFKVKVDENSKILTLSTCNNHVDRTVLHAVLIEE